MECPNCEKTYNAGSNIPLILIECGHTICEKCCTELFKKNAIKCPDCGTWNHAKELKQFPKNRALLSIPTGESSPNKHCSGDSSNNSPYSKKSKKPKVPICLTHKKKVEAFCEDCKCLLCIDCILIEGHKAHNISSIGQV